MAGLAVVVLGPSGPILRPAHLGIFSSSSYLSSWPFHLHSDHLVLAACLYRPEFLERQLVAYEEKVSRALAPGHRPPLKKGEQG